MSGRSRMDRFLQRHYDRSIVGLASKGLLEVERHGRLPPHLWEDLRLTFQRRWREATGEEHAIIEITPGAEP